MNIIDLVLPVALRELRKILPESFSMHSESVNKESTYYRPFILEGHAENITRVDNKKYSRQKLESVLISDFCPSFLKDTSG